MTNIEKLNYLDKAVKEYIQKNIETDSEVFHRKNDQHIWIFITPWFNSAVRHFASVFVLLLRKNGIDVSLLVDDIVEFIEYDCDKEKKKTLQLIEAFRETDIPVEYLSSYNEPNSQFDEQDHAIIEKCAKYRCIHHVGSSAYLSEQDDLFRRHFLEVNRCYAAIKGFVNTNSGIIVLPGGICANTGLFFEYSKLKKDIRIASYDDASVSHIFFSPNGIATHLRGVNATFELFLANEKLRRKAYAWSEQEMSKRRERGTNHVRLKDHYDVVILLNIEWDSAALMVGEVYDTALGWLASTLKYLKENYSVKIAVRQHPHEALCDKENIWEKWFVENYGSDENVRFISACEEINTYELIANSRIVLPWSSTAGIEAAIIGKPVVMHTNAYYCDSSFVQRCKTENEYFDCISRLLGCFDNTLSEAAIKEAEVYYYLTQKEERLPTLNFSPNFDDMMRLMRTDINEVLEDEGVNELIDSLLLNKSISYIRCSRL